VLFEEIISAKDHTMDILHIPFSKLINLVFHDSENTLALPFTGDKKNHLGTFHAAAQFALAEAASGLALQQNFPHLEDSVIPVMRKSEVKYKKPAQSDIFAKGKITAEEKARFENQLDKKGRAIITVLVDIIDSDDIISMTGTFEWFVQKL
jgi:acyl-coenzyme A thioesterase PaaI-like protein